MLIKIPRILKKLPEQALSGQFIDRFVRKKLKIPHFLGVFMLDALPPHKSRRREVLVINLASTNTAGTHWVALQRSKGVSYYFDSYGLRPPTEIVNYCRGDQILYNKKKFQNLGSTEEECLHCGHLVLLFICKICKTHLRRLNLQLVEMNLS